MQHEASGGFLAVDTCDSAPRRPANKIGWRKTLQMKQRTRDTAQRINCIKKRINPCALEGLCLEIKNLI
ncbi:hypothetical protein CHARACLAT_030672 [Characodon lateralis]|uniref:Uncharacterized protein n=1 Tax=Characodon lateralis TaxID=208331 RepID=A0ABU7DVM1_9TELE|nr:hypothetical protein [Characodon lateralis]